MGARSSERHSAISCYAHRAVRAGGGGMQTRGFSLRMRNIAGGITRITLRRYEHPASPSKLPLVMLGLNQPHLVRSDLVLFQYLQQPATTATGDWYPVPVQAAPHDSIFGRDPRKLC